MGKFIWLLLVTYLTYCCTTTQSALSVVYRNGTFYEGLSVFDETRATFCDVGFNFNYVFPVRTGTVNFYNYIRNNIGTPLVNDIRNPSGECYGSLRDAVGRIYLFQGAGPQGFRAVSRIDPNQPTVPMEILVNGFAAPEYGNNVRPFNGPDDGALDKLGNIVFTDPIYHGTRPKSLPTAVYWLNTTSNEVIRLIVGPDPNGIDFSPDGKILYILFSDNGKEELFGPPAPRLYDYIFAYPYNACGPSVGVPIMIANLTGTGGGDGIKVDPATGNIYVIMSGDLTQVPILPSGYRVYSHTGALLRTSNVPDGLTATSIALLKRPLSHRLDLTWPVASKLVVVAGVNQTAFSVGDPSGFLATEIVIGV